MRVLLYSRGFFPALGGLESVTRLVIDEVALAQRYLDLYTEILAERSR